MIIRVTASPAWTQFKMMELVSSCWDPPADHREMRLPPVGRTHSSFWAVLCFFRSVSVYTYLWLYHPPCLMGLGLGYIFLVLYYHITLCYHVITSCLTFIVITRNYQVLTRQVSHIWYVSRYDIINFMFLCYNMKLKWTKQNAAKRYHVLEAKLWW